MGKLTGKLTELTGMQRQFIIEYNIDQDPKQAAIRAGYSKKTASQQASRLLKNVNIQAEVNKVNKLVVEKALDEAGITVQMIIDGLRKITDFDIRKILDKDGKPLELKDYPDDIALALAGIEIETKTVGTGEKATTTTNIKVKQPDRKGAWELLGRYKAMFVDKKIIVDETTDEQKKVLEQLKKHSKAINFNEASEKLKGE